MARKGGKDRGLFEYPSASGTWWIRYAGGEGKEHSEKVGPKGLAKKRYMQRKTEVAEGRYFPVQRGGQVLIDDLIEDYKKATARRGTSIMRTDSGYRRVLATFGGRRADAIGARDVEEWRDELSETLSAASVAHHLTMLRAIFNRAIRDGKVKTSPTRAVEWPEENNARVRWLSTEEEGALRSSLSPWLRPLLTFGIHTGMRLGEILALRWADVDVGSGSVHVRESKSGLGRRLPLNETAKGLLAEFRDTNGLVFQRDCNALRMKINREFRRAAKAAAVPNVHIHDLRHTFASRLVMEGVDLYTVQMLLGHKTARMTQRYSHLSPNHLRAAVVKLDRGPGFGPG